MAIRVAFDKQNVADTPGLLAICHVTRRVHITSVKIREAFILCARQASLHCDICALLVCQVDQRSVLIRNYRHIVNINSTMEDGIVIHSPVYINGRALPRFCDLTSRQRSIKIRHDIWCIRKTTVWFVHINRSNVYRRLTTSTSKLINFRFKGRGFEARKNYVRINTSSKLQRKTWYLPLKIFVYSKQEKSNNFCSIIF